MGTLFCTACGTPVRRTLEGGKVLAERVAATPVYGAPPPGEGEAAPPRKVFMDELFADQVRVDEPESESAPLVERVPLPAKRYTPEFAAPDPEGKRRLSRKVVMLGAAGLAVVLLVAVVFVRPYLRDRPTHAALDKAGASYDSVITALGKADDLAAIQAAGQQAQGAGAALAEQEETLASQDGELAAAARDVVRAQRAVIAAATGLTGVSEKDLSIWSAAAASLTQTREALVVAVDDLAKLDEGAADDVLDPARAIDHARTVVGLNASEQVTTSLEKLVTRLGKVDRTIQLRKIAGSAAERAAVVRAAQGGLTGDSDESVREAGVAFDRLSRLGAVDADHLDVWSATRVELLAALGGVEGLDAAPAVAHVDEVIFKAVSTMDQWAKDVAKAKRKQGRALAVVTTYESAVRAQLATFDGLRSSLAAFMGQVDAGAVSAPAPALQQGAIGRQNVFAALQGIAAPSEFATAGKRLTRVVFRAQLVLQTAFDATADNDCGHTCFYNGDYRTSDDYAALQAGSARVAGAYTQALSAWNSAIASVTDRIEARKLPKKPRV